MSSNNLFGAKLREQSVEQIVYVHDYLQIALTSGMTLTINNSYSVSGGDIKDIVGARITKTEVKPDAFTIHFGSKFQLRIGLSSQDYACPEAMVLHGNKEGIIVWR